MGLGLFKEDGGDHGWYVKGGYGYIVPLGGLLLKPSIDLYYLIGKNKIGTIDNTQKEISLLGYTAYDQSSPGKEWVAEWALRGDKYRCASLGGKISYIFAVYN